MNDSNWCFILEKLEGQGFCNLDEVRAAHIQKFLLVCSETCSVGSVHNIRIYLKKLYAYLTLSFTEQLKSDTDCAASTCNTRLAAIRSFMEYAAGWDITLAATLEKLKKISLSAETKAELSRFRA